MAIMYDHLANIAERTIALAQLRKRRNPAEGYDPLLKRRVEMLLPVLRRQGVRLISNFGAANPLAGADAILEIARRLDEGLGTWVDPWGIRPHLPATAILFSA